MPTRELPDHETDFLTHFAELRARLWWCVAAVAAMMGVGWFLFEPAYALLCGPVVAAVRAQGGTVMTMGLTEAFFTRVKLAGALGLILASPVILWQVWAFIRPGLTPHERRVAAPIAPAICLLFLLGAGLAYLLLPKIIAFFLSYVGDLRGVTPNLMLQDSINFPLKVLVAFGLGFQLPVALVALVALRLLTPRTLLRQWRIA
ncbi:MAG TPA: twin-arginine translocase subunit TatC, partial [Armatimonadota bacterium]|nr:twin-arginine translocase subunit TatC [Armatimonadota bacterium]